MQNANKREKTDVYLQWRQCECYRLDLQMKNDLINLSRASLKTKIMPLLCFSFCKTSQPPANHQLHLEEERSNNSSSRRRRNGQRRVQNGRSYDEILPPGKLASAKIQFQFFVIYIMMRKYSSSHSPLRMPFM